MNVRFDRSGIESLLRELADELNRRGAQADLFLVGGGAMALAYDSRRATRDLDAVFAPTTVIREAATSTTSSCCTGCVGSRPSTKVWTC